MKERVQFLIKLSVPATLFIERVDNDTVRAALDAAERYLRSAVNERSGGRRCFAGESLRHALDLFRRGVARVAGVTEDDVFLFQEGSPAVDGEYVDLSLEDCDD